MYVVNVIHIVVG